MFRVFTFVLVFILSLSWAAHAVADGKVFPKRATAKVNMPDQEALIHWADGVETMVIQTGFSGEGDEFAWVVPTPSEPEVTASTTGLFTTLRVLTAPKMKHTESMLFLFFWLVALSVLCCAAGRYIDVLIVLTLIALVVGVLLPASGAARSVVTVGTTEVHQRGVVGNYEVAVISSDDADSLSGWLEDNGFYISDDSRQAIEHYVFEGWYFTATRLRPELAAEGGALTHPLGFRFAVEKPIYPLRLTAAGSTLLDIDLYVFGPERAAVDGFEVAYCNRTDSFSGVDIESWPRPRDIDEMPIRHPELVRLVQPSAYVTKLSACLTPDQMSRDAMIRWSGDELYVPERWTEEGAVRVAANVGFISLSIAVMLLPVIYPRRAWMKEAKGRAARFVLGACAVSLVLGLGTYLLLPKHKAQLVTASRVRWSIMRGTLNNLVDGIDDPDGYEATIQAILVHMKNPTTGQDMKIDDSPGNFTYEWTDDGLVITAFGPDGAPLRIDKQSLER